MTSYTLYPLYPIVHEPKNQERAYNNEKAAHNFEKLKNSLNLQGNGQKQNVKNTPARKNSFSNFNVCFSFAVSKKMLKIRKTNLSKYKTFQINA